MIRLERINQIFGAAAHIELAWQLPLGGQAALHTGSHNTGDPVDKVQNLGAWALCQLIFEHHIGDRFLCRLRHLQKLRPRAIRKRQRDALSRNRQFRPGLHDKAAADGKPCVLQDRGAAGVEGGKMHRVGVLGAVGVKIENQIFRRIKCHQQITFEGDFMMGMELLQKAFGLIGINRGRFKAAKPQKRGSIGAVAFTCPSQRTEQRDHDRGAARRIGALQQRVSKSLRGLHRPHSVRRRRADANLEQVEQTNHSIPP